MRDEAKQILEHWRCPACDTFDGPISNGDDCDVCMHDNGIEQQVVRLVPAAERDRYREALREIADYVFANDDPEGLDATVFQQIARAALNGDTE